MLKFADLKEGEQVSFQQYLTVDSVNPTDNSINVTDGAGKQLLIRGKELIEGSFYSNSQFSETEKGGKNKLAEVLKDAKDVIFTVCFTKKNGDERILVGRLVGSEPNLGRTKVVDLNIDPNDPTRGIRLIDNREIKWVVINQTKYVAQ
jgi:hypothetical protein